MTFELEDQTWFVHLHNNVKQEWRVENREQKKELFQMQLEALLESYRRNWEVYQDLYSQTRKFQVDEFMNIMEQKQIVNNSHEFNSLQARIEKQLEKCKALNVQIDSIIKELSSKYYFTKFLLRPPYMFPHFLFWVIEYDVMVEGPRFDSPEPVLPFGELKGFVQIENGTG